MAMFSDKSPEPTPFTPVSFVDGHVSYIRIYCNANLDMTRMSDGHELKEVRLRMTV